MESTARTFTKTVEERMTVTVAFAAGFEKFFLLFGLRTSLKFPDNVATATPVGILFKMLNFRIKFREVFPGI